jgi:predicted acylesterase/phospholipase RssA
MAPTVADNNQLTNLDKSSRIGVVLSSGGGRGVYAHTGFLLALEQLGIQVAAIAGCSAGALVGGVAASGADLHRWAEAIARVRTQEYWTPDSWLRFFWQFAVRKGRGYTGLSGTDAAVEFCRRNLAVQTFEECPVPFYTMAMNLGRRTKVLFAKGDLAPRVMASAAIPVLYRPVEIDGELYTDGAVIELAPTEALCCRHRLDALIIHHTAVYREGPTGLAHALMQPWSLVEILNLLLYRQRPWYLAGKPLNFARCPAGCGAPIIVLEPDLPDLTWPLAEGGVQVQHAAIEQTERLLRPYLEALRTNPGQLLAQVAEVTEKPAAGQQPFCEHTP